MAAVIRDARIEPERLLLAVIARQASAAATPAPPPAARTAPSPEQPASAPGAEWLDTAPVSPAEGLQREIDREAEEQAFRQRLEAERLAALERAEAEGFAAGQRRGEALHAEQLEVLAGLIASTGAALEAGIAGSEDVLVEIAFEAAGKILGEAMLQREGVVAIVREILRGVRERERLVVRVSPADHAALAAHRAQLLQGEDGRTIDLVADERVALGGCLVETTGGTLDGRLETQLQRLAETLSGARRMQGEGMP